MISLRDRLHDRVERMWWRDTPPSLWLRCIEPVYAAISRIHLQRRAGTVMQPPLPMISVGNITAGGSGKTPFVLWLADGLQSIGYAPVILCRGDGGKTTAPAVVGSDDPAGMVGDEARMLADLSGCPVIAAADRIAGSRLAEGLGDVIILDDGFQYRHLGRCCDIVLAPAEGVGNGHQIPAGPLREPVAALARADMIVRTGNATAFEACHPLSSEGEWRWMRKPGKLMDMMDQAQTLPASVYAVTAIARPQRFFDDLKATGLTLVGSKSYPDHYPFTDRDVHALLKLYEEIAVTAKDAVKLAPLWPQDRCLWVLPVQGTSEPELLAAIAGYLTSAG